jgi:Na+/H+ antiporter NhaD/arsenite permease-like protein
MIASGALPPLKGYQTIDIETVTLLLGMMIVAANLRLGWRGVHGAADTAAAAVILLAGTSSAFLVDVAICLVMTPLVVELAISVQRQPSPATHRTC